MFVNFYRLLIIMAFFPLQAQNVDIAFVMDGSGSISDEDFRIQIQGMRNGFERLLPTDGSQAVTVIQFAGTSTRVEIPYTLVSNRRDVTTLLLQLSRIEQLGGSTNPGDGVVTATTVLNNSGRASAEQRICLTTDGIPNSGADLATALTDARNSPIGIDRFGVVAIEDLPETSSADFERIYRPLLFGGELEITRNATEFANFIGIICFVSETASLIGLEAIQVIQDWQGNIPLIADKTTYVRAHFAPPTGGNPILVSARLHGEGPVGALPGSPLSPQRPSSIIVRSSSKRSDLTQSLNFHLPSSWTEEGTITLSIEGFGELNCIAAIDGDGDCSAEVTFTTVSVPEIRYVPIHWRKNNVLQKPTPQELINTPESLVSMFPIPEVNASFRAPLSLTGSPPNLSDVLLELERARKKDLYTLLFDPIYYGVLSGTGGSNVGKAYRSGKVSCGFLKPSSIQAHEIAHNLGLSHIPFCSPSGPYDSFPAQNVINGKPSLGPQGLGQDRDIYGLDTMGTLKILRSFLYNDLMSYCLPHWVSNSSYLRLIQAINNTFQKSASHTELFLGAGDYLIVQGSGNNDGFLGNGITLRPFTRDTLQNQPEPVGSHTLQAKNALGQVLTQIIFDPDFETAENEDESLGTFFLAVPYHSGIASIDIFAPDMSLIASRSASASPPTIQVLSPNGGEHFDDDFLIQWQVSDPNGGELTSFIDISWDGGLSWEYIGSTTQTSHSVNVALLKGGDQVLVRVRTSDGFHQSEDSSNAPFSIINHQPIMAIKSPKKGQQFAGLELLFLDAGAYDLEDGQLENESISFISNIDGFLGYSGSTIRVDDLSEGTHNIRVHAIDSQGLETIDTTNIRVEWVAAIPCIAAIEGVNQEITKWPTKTVLEFVDLINQACNTEDLTEYPMNNTRVTTCGGVFSCSGGLNQYYSNDENFTKTFIPSEPNQHLEFNFIEFNTELDYDFLTIHDGNTTSAPIIVGPISGSQDLGTIQSTAPDGSLTFVFRSDGSVTAHGWLAMIRCIPQ